jgi:hypothetical protein
MSGDIAKVTASVRTRDRSGVYMNTHHTPPMLRTRTVALVAAIALVAACGDRSRQASADSDLANDLALANQTPAVPLLRDTALAPAPAPASTSRRAQPVSAPRATTRSTQPRVQTRPPVVTPVTSTTPAPSPATRGFGAGTVLALTTNSQVCTTNLPGDKIVATLTSPVSGENGAYLPAGTSVVLEVASITQATGADSARINLRVRSILVNNQPVSAPADVAVLSPLEKDQIPGSKTADRNKVIGGAVAGAILGQIMGKNTKSTVIGAAAGAAAGAGAAALSRKYDACLPAGGAVRVTTSQPITISD